MADNNHDNNEVAAAAVDSRTYVETKIERLKSDNPKEKLFNITFDKFEDLPSEKGDKLRSSIFSCFGAEWRLQLCPGGWRNSSDGMVAVFLQRCSKGRNLSLKFSFELCTFDGSDRIRREGTSTITILNAWGWGEFCLRKEIIESEEDEGFLVDGALTIRVGMQLDEFIPKNPIVTNIFKLFDDEKTADIVFEICEQQTSESESDGKRAKISTEKLYHAHRLILQQCSPELSALCATSDGMTPIIITDIKPEVFRRLLYYVYGGEISNEEFVGNEKDIIRAANKYGVTNLKLEAEVRYVNNTEITIDNVIDNLLYADAMNCALLKESVMEFIVENQGPVIQRVSFDDVPGDVCKDLLVAVSRHYEENDETDIEKMYSTMRIRYLREMLHDKGLDIDGSREALIASLKEHSAS